MNIGDRHRAAMASCRLQRVLMRRHPDCFVYGGISLDKPGTILIRADKDIDVPNTFKHEEDIYTVEFEVK